MKFSIAKVHTSYRDIEFLLFLNAKLCSGDENEAFGGTACIACDEADVADATEGEFDPFTS